MLSAVSQDGRRSRMREAHLGAGKSHTRASATAEQLVRFSTRFTAIRRRRRRHAATFARAFAARATRATRSTQRCHLRTFKVFVCLFVFFLKKNQHLHR